MAQTKTHTCTLCGQPITLVPSAEERSRKTGLPADFFRSLFTQHTACTLDQAHAGHHRPHSPHPSQSGVTHMTTAHAQAHRAIAKVIELAAQHGFTLHSVSDGEDRHDVSTLEQALEHVFSVNESWVYFTPPPTNPSPVRHCIYIVLGNAGWDAIANHSVAREPGDTWDTVIEAHSAWLDEEYP